MKRVKQLNCWGIYQNNPKEFKEYGFEISVLHPDNMGYSYLCTPVNSDMEFNSVAQAEEWIKNY